MDISYCIWQINRNVSSSLWGTQSVPDELNSHFAPVTKIVGHDPQSTETSSIPFRPCGHTSSASSSLSLRTTDGDDALGCLMTPSRQGPHPAQRAIRGSSPQLTVHTVDVESGKESPVYFTGKSASFHLNHFASGNLIPSRRKVTVCWFCF